MAVTEAALRDGEGSGSAIRESAARARTARGITFHHRMPLARKIIAINLLAIVVLAAGTLIFNPFRDTLVSQREAGLVAEARLLAGVFEAELAQRPDARLGRGLDPAATLARLDLGAMSEVFVFDDAQALLASTIGLARATDEPGPAPIPDRTTFTDALDAAWSFGAALLSRAEPPRDEDHSRRLARRLVARTLLGETHVETGLVGDGGATFAVASPIQRDGEVMGAVALTSGAGEIDHLVRAEREQVLRLFVVALLVSVGLSLVLASTIANPLADLAAAAETGRERQGGSVRAPRISIPDLGDRPDEIGRLSTALQGMVGALYSRIDANEQFAADVAHEIKNPLASLRSAVGSLRRVTRDDQRDRLLDVIEHDVRRMDRLVSDISNASRLDSELVREDEERFDLLSMLTSMADHMGNQARAREIDFVADLPAGPIWIEGLESRLAQVFVNLLGNAVSFCGPGDTIRLWARRRENRMLVVVEDTGPGIPDSALTRIFERFYSERPKDQFGDNSGLGLAISKQIVEAHGGVIWAENIEHPRMVEPAGARFVVGLPL